MTKHSHTTNLYSHKGLTRRTLLTEGTAAGALVPLAAAPALAGTVSHGTHWQADAELLDLQREWMDTILALEKLHDKQKARGAGWTDATLESSGMNALADRMLELERQILEMPATTLAGVRAKLVLFEYYQGSAGTDYALSALQDLRIMPLLSA